MSSTLAKRKKSKTLNPPLKHNQAWSRADREYLREMLERGSSTKEAANALGRTIPSVWSQKYQMLREGSIKGEKRFTSSREAGSESPVSHPKGTREVKEPLTSPTNSKTPEPSFLDTILTTLSTYGLSAKLEVQNGKLKSIVLE